jgi:hypothetical protein
MAAILNLLLCLTLSFSAFARGHRAKSAPKAFASKVHLTKVGTCDVPEAAAGAKKVLVIKQWHLSPRTTTKGFKEKYPQEKNQTAIYHFLEDSVKHGDLQLLLSEGCEGEINADFKTAFNGWDYPALKGQAFQKGYDKIITLVPLKIEAKYGDKIATFCGDNDEAIHDGLEKMSNLRGWMGFYVRLSEFKNNPEKLKLYTDSAADLLKVSKDTPADKLLTQIKERIKEELEGFNKSLQTRNEFMVKALQAHEYSKAAIVIGGLHANGLKEKLEKAGLGCEIYEPPGYQPDDEKLVHDFENAMK